MPRSGISAGFRVQSRSGNILYWQQSFDAMTVALAVASDGKFLIGKLQKFPVGGKSRKSPAKIFTPERKPTWQPVPVLRFLLSISRAI